ncbi:MAG: hypothetical protein LBH40_03695 [Alphaproteobacteria bacterium]|jgi:hypothetical protein|nr:hypothetical protein [Alphaproteobacteria bacterium]
MSKNDNKIQLDITENDGYIEFKFTKGDLEEKVFKYPIEKRALYNGSTEIELISLDSNFYSYIESITEMPYNSDSSRKHIIIRNKAEWERFQNVEKLLPYNGVKNARFPYAYLFMEDLNNINGLNVSKSIFAVDIQVLKDTPYNYSSCIFAGKFNMSTQKYSGTNFSYCIFFKSANFNNTVFTAKANFDCTFFQDEVSFNDNIFTEQLYFSNSKLKDKSSFCYVEFNNSSTFNNTIFEKEVNFYHARLNRGVFLSTTFKDLANFRRTTFTNRCYFTTEDDIAAKTIFKKDVIFKDSTFSNIADFRNTEIKGKLDISMSSFTYLWLGNTKISKFNAENTLIEKNIVMNKNNIESADNADSYRLLKDQAIKQNDRILAWEFHKLEMDKRCGSFSKDPILLFNKYTNQHGTNALLAMMWVLLVTALGSFLETYFFHEQFINIIRNYNPFSMVKNFEFIFISQFFTHFFFTVLLLSLIWQLLQAFRRHGRMP